MLCFRLPSLFHVEHGIPFAPSLPQDLFYVKPMTVTLTSFGSWSGGRFMNFGQPIDEDRWIRLVRSAYDQGVRTFITADVYGLGKADELLGRALQGIPRDSYCLVGTVGHDFYATRRDGAKGYPRFTDPQLRSSQDYASYLRSAIEKSLTRCQASAFDVVLLHNPDSIGYTQDSVWNGMQKLVDAGLTRELGVAPGPANGFTLDLLLCFERFGALLDWAMIILNPFEPWPGSLLLPAAQRFDIPLITRVVDFGGIFHDDVRPGHAFGTADHRVFRPPGWVDDGFGKLQKLRPIAERHGLTALQLACAWNLAHEPVRNVVPTLIEEVGPGNKSIETKLAELAAVRKVNLSEEEIATIHAVGDNRGCMALKGANRSHLGSPLPDVWGITPELDAVARRWGIEPDRDLVLLHAA